MNRSIDRKSSSDLSKSPAIYFPRAAISRSGTFGCEKRRRSGGSVAGPREGDQPRPGRQRRSIVLTWRPLGPADGSCGKFVPRTSKMTKVGRCDVDPIDHYVQTRQNSQIIYRIPETFLGAVDDRQQSGVRVAGPRVAWAVVRVEDDGVFFVRYSSGDAAARAARGRAGGRERGRARARPGAGAGWLRASVSRRVSGCDVNADSDYGERADSRSHKRVVVISVRVPVVCFVSVQCSPAGGAPFSSR
ncbi:hypothetical protein EVAR_95364_1 [Eumeta japonica]|uniref:Uncharacterized protein n=1 Tax=Eumeta variegata TaxID=151549 RepID=A0A4C1U948_EUMVA|nr:hypothetical protein EVAR_95364_1 [Eumeta japonica]